MDGVVIGQMLRGLVSGEWLAAYVAPKAFDKGFLCGRWPLPSSEWSGSFGVGNSLPNKSMQTGGRVRFKGILIVFVRAGGRVITAKRRERLRAVARS